MDVVGGQVLPDEYFTRVRRSSDSSSITMMDEKEKAVNSLTVDTDNVVFTKDHYVKSGRIDFNDVFREFQAIWQACDAVLKVRDIRRIGMVGEYRIVPPNNPSAALLSFTHIEARGVPAKFQMQFESRVLTTGDSGLPDVKTSDFWNTIESYYDSALDTEHSEEGQITAMIDVQRYYMPLLDGNVPDDVRKLKRRYDDVVRQIGDRAVIKSLELETRSEHVEQAE